MTDHPHPRPAAGSPVECLVRPYATSVTWRNEEGGSWQQWHDEDDPLPAEWGDRPPDEVVHVYTAAQVTAMLATERERCASKCRRPPGWLSDAQQQVVDEIRRAIESGA